VAEDHDSAQARREDGGNRNGLDTQMIDLRKVIRQSGAVLQLFSSLYPTGLNTVSG
jgi:hypothetical protein